MDNSLQGENYGRFAPEEIIDDWATAFVHVGVAHTSNALSVYKSKHSINVWSRIGRWPMRSASPGDFDGVQSELGRFCRSTIRANSSLS